MTDSSRLPFDEPDEPAALTRRIFTVDELTAAIRGELEAKYSQVWVDGEISNARVWKTGHLYFTLKDSKAQLSGVMYRSSFRYLRFKPENGHRVVARGRISVYPPKGEYQIVCDHMEPQGVGALQLAFEQLRERLGREGLFDNERKRPLPALPRKIGLVTSVDGAAIRDVLNVLRRRHPSAHIVIGPARVQGDGAAAQIVRSLTHLGRIPGIDVVIVARGGGSIEDLWAFNEEPVARAIAASPIPVISAIGHETDYTISDFVADLRAPTPSAAAELVVARKDEMHARIQRATERLTAAVEAGLQRRRELVHRLERRPGFSGWPAQLAVRGRQAVELTHRLSQAGRSGIVRRQRRAHAVRLRLEAVGLDRRLGQIRTRLLSAHTELRRAMSERLGRHDRGLRAAAARLETLSPLGVLGRGYAVCWNADRSALIRNATDVDPGDSVTITLHRGELDCEVKGTT